MKPEGRWSKTYGGFQRHGGTPNSWMVDSMENPTIKMDHKSGDIPILGSPHQSCLVVPHDIGVHPLLEMIPLGWLNRAESRWSRFSPYLPWSQVVWSSSLIEEAAVWEGHLLHYSLDFLHIKVCYWMGQKHHQKIHQAVASESNLDPAIPASEKGAEWSMKWCDPMCFVIQVLFLFLTTLSNPLKGHSLQLYSIYSYMFMDIWMRDYIYIVYI